MKERKTGGKKRLRNESQNRPHKRNFRLFMPMKVIWINNTRTKMKFLLTGKIWFSNQQNRQEEKYKTGCCCSVVLLSLSICVFHFISEMHILMSRKNTKPATTSANQIECKVNVNQRCNKSKMPGLRACNRTLAAKRRDIASRQAKCNHNKSTQKVVKCTACG